MTQDEPFITSTHYVYFALVTVFGLLCSLPQFTYFDALTMKPHPSMDPIIRQVAHVTNIPIKLGFVHVGFYALEFWMDPMLFRRHVGQRLTTLWYQLFQPVRWGQHLQMHLETCLQFADAISHRKAAGYSNVHLGLISVFSLILLAQAALTSLGWHDFNEQFAGFALALLKLAFDYSHHGNYVNSRLGSVFEVAAHWLGGALVLLVAHGINGFAALHPTLTASLFFLGVFFVAASAPRVLLLAKRYTAARMVIAVEG